MLETAIDIISGFAAVAIAVSFWRFADVAEQTLRQPKEKDDD